MCIQLFALRVQTTATMAPTRPVSASDESSRKRHPVTELERQKIRKYQQDHPGVSQRKIAAWASNEFKRKINQSIVSTTVTTKGDKYDYLDKKKFARGTVGNARLYQADLPDLEKALFEWVIRMEGNVPVTGDMVKTCAHEIFNKMPQYDGKKEPKWSDKWLHDFKKRHGIKRRKQHGESASVNMEGAEERLAECQQLAKKYGSDDLYNADETALFWLAVPETTLATKPQSGKKKEKKRLTILVTTNCSGTHKMNHWIIGNAQNPRAFGRRSDKIKNEPMTWRANKKAWMTGKIWIEYLTWFAKEIRARHTREVLLFVDSFSSHCSGLSQLLSADNELPENDRALRQVRVEFLPKNATSLYQPCDQGIIANLKTLYKKEWLTSMVASTLANKDPLKEMTQLQAVRWINSIWKRTVKPETINNCWVKSRILGVRLGPNPRPADWNEAPEVSHDEDLAEVVELMQELQDCEEQGGQTVTIADAEGFVNPEDEQVKDSMEPDELLEHVVDLFSSTNLEDSSDDEEECHSLMEKPQPGVTAKQAVESIALTLAWLQDNSEGHHGTIDALRRALREASRKVLAQKGEQARQSRIEDFFGMGMDLE